MQLSKDKKIKQIRDTVEGYLKIEKELNQVIDGKTGDYGRLSGREEIITEKLNREIDLQSNYLETLLKEFGFEIHPIELIDIYSENKLKAIQILEGFEQ